MTILLLFVLTNRQISVQADNDQRTRTTTVDSAKHAFEEALLHQKWQESHPPAASTELTIVDIEEEEATIVENLCVTATTHLRFTLRLTVDAIRRISDTAAAIISGLAKAVAGAFKLSADGIWIIATRLAQPRAPDDRMPHFLDRMGRRVAKVMHTSANLLYGMSEACILTSETSEAFSSSLGQAIEDSFNGLEFLSYSLQQGLSLLLSTGMKRRNGQERRARRNQPGDYDSHLSSIPQQRRRSRQPQTATNQSTQGDGSQRPDDVDENDLASPVSMPTEGIPWDRELNHLSRANNQTKTSHTIDTNHDGRGDKSNDSSSDNVDETMRNEFSFWKDVLVLLRDVSREV